MNATRDFVMPRLGLTMKQGKVTRWYRRPGEKVRRGESVLQVTTEKVAVDVDATFDGVLVEILVGEGQTVPVGTPIARVEVAEAAGAAAGASAAAGPVAPPVAVAVGPSGSAPAAAAAPTAAGAAPVKAAPAVGPVRATPAAKRVARELGVDLALVAGGGPEGRITEDDVRRQAAGDEVRPHSEWRLAVAEKMAAASRTTAAVTLHREVDFSRAAALLGAPAAKESGVGPADLVVRAVADGLTEHPDLNATFTEEALVRHREMNIGVALALPAGLIVPVIRGCTGLSVAELATRRRSLWERAKGGSLGPDDVSGGTFTVTNLGPFGIDGFTPIINPPEVAVLGMGRIAERPSVEDGRVVVRPAVNLSLTFDHRAVDGAPAAAFLATVAARLEDPPGDWFLGGRSRPPAPRRARPTGDDGFDLVIIGAGPAGYAAAVHGAERGARVALVEAEEVGGVCLNRGCVPTKAALEYLQGERRLQSGTGGLALAVEGVVREVRSGVEGLLTDLGVAVVRGEARVAGPEAPAVPAGSDAAPLVFVGERLLRGAAVIVATGCAPVPVDVPAHLLDGPRARVISVEDLLVPAGRPDSAGSDGSGTGAALIIGGGTGGVEAARILALAGSAVTLAERLPTLLPGEEEDVGALVRSGLERIGVRVLTGVAASDLPAEAGPFALVVVAAGRRPRTASLGLAERLLDERGFVIVDDFLGTGVAGLYAAGDVAGPPFWAHRAMEEGRVAVHNALGELEGLADMTAAPAPRRRPRLDQVPRVVFGEPEFGAVGLSRLAAERAGHRVVVGTAPMAGSARARAAGVAEGFVRVIADRDTGLVLGLEAACPRATELVAAGLVALGAGLGLAELAALPFPHPTYVESVGDAARDALRAFRGGPGT
jgi:pyruvate dehydrogenase E2 component (dihydrolipoamide acetyltransferase)